MSTRPATASDWIRGQYLYHNCPTKRRLEWWEEKQRWCCMGCGKVWSDRLVRGWADQDFSDRFFVVEPAAIDGGTYAVVEAECGKQKFTTLVPAHSVRPEDRVKFYS